MREYNHKPNKAFQDLPHETLIALLLPAVHGLLNALDKKDEQLIKFQKKEVELLYCAIDSLKPKKHAEAVSVEPLPQQKDIDKQINSKNKELRSLGKELKSRRKKRSGIVIGEEMMQLNKDVAGLNEQPTEPGS